MFFARGHVFLKSVVVILAVVIFVLLTVLIVTLFQRLGGVAEQTSLSATEVFALALDERIGLLSVGDGVVLVVVEGPQGRQRALWVLDKDTLRVRQVLSLKN